MDDMTDDIGPGGDGAHIDDGEELDAYALSDKQVAAPASGHSVEITADFPPDEKTVDAAFDVMSRSDSRTATALRREWGADASSNLKYAKIVSDEFMTPALKELLTVEIGNNGMLGDHPVVMDLAAKIGRRLAQERGNQTYTQETISMPENQRQQIEGLREDLTEQIHEAQMHGKSSKAKRLMAQREKLTARLFGNGPIIGQGSRYI